MVCTSSELHHASDSHTAAPRDLLKAREKALCLHTRLGAPRVSQAHCINPSLKQLQQHQEALTTSGQGTAKPLRATSRGKQDLLVLPASTTILSILPSSLLSTLQLPILLLHAHSLYFNTQDCAFSFILCHCCSTPVSLLQLLNLCGFFHFQHFQWIIFFI